MWRNSELDLQRALTEELEYTLACFESELDSCRMRVEELTEANYELHQVLETKDAEIASQWSTICILRNQLDWAMQRTDEEERRAQELAHQLDWAMQRTDEEERRAQELAHHLDLAKKKSELEERRAQELEHQLDQAMQKTEQEERRFHELNRLLEEERWLRIQADNKNCIQKTHKLYIEYTFEELKLATNHFSERNKLCEDACGVIYKGKLHGMDVAVLKHGNEGTQGKTHFITEVELLSQIHHPHVAMVLGACTQRACIVYEYMSNGSLQDRLNRKQGSLPLSWSVRLRICFEIATGLLFLHCHEPPVILTDLKPSNIWLDHNNISKINGLGMAKLLKQAKAKAIMSFGRSEYMDPQCLRTGNFTCASDVYALGIIMLQLLTGRSPHLICDKVDRAFDKLHGILDKSAGEWPLAKAMEFAQLGLRCAESSPSDRPSLEEVLDILQNIRECGHEVATEPSECDNEAVNEPRECEHETVTEPLSTTTIGTDIPSCFYCPISKEIMINPCIAEDGFTYEREIIEEWLQNHNTSPMTNLRLSHKRLTPNRSVKSAIQDWTVRGLIHR